MRRDYPKSWVAINNIDNKSNKLTSTIYDEASLGVINSRPLEVAEWEVGFFL